MELNNWSEELNSYDLSNEYSIQKAEPEEWGLYCSVYYNMAYTGFFREEGYFNVSRNNSFWIYKGESKIGGVRMAPNTLYHLFFMPPFNDSFEVLKLLKTILIKWSDPSQRIKIYEILPDQVHLFTRAGFWPDEFRCRWMQRPTDHFNVHWDHDLIVKSPEIIENETGAKQYINEDEIAQCDLDSFVGGFEALRRKKTSLEDFIPNEEIYYTNKILTQASTLVYDKVTGQLIANCRLCLQDNQAAVYSIGVNPAYRGKGLATRMLQRALTELKDKYPVLRLYVMEGNDAESVYFNLGFVPGVQEIQTMYVPVHE
ncbi:MULTISPECIES: GNAT family N-acetyltransferase [unclassified Paenibacillus]|uniref:GNAT family N-acetyltransferase n=1 Tax=unclassified Paenibacillus TaxID=185978 RepID=UPI0009A59A46|nr:MULTISPECIES: GNAT family N-acetyltransferase [unclassified Paenibacillus]SLJ96714.1 Acetyltransferase (GNAT) domain-containing protein [Paenibacillus sp. RU5A]SOC67076.1 Acetyltransferase (GNAT) domain-containing protein [Paenibacillus sp. RU26A]SOC69776.1 Acetyltransferase (GNAT) domain-containing protein [Paenibacillus sp. RU5M]